MSDPNGPKRISIALSRETHQRLMTAAEERLVSPGLIAARAIEKFLDQLGPVGEMFPHQNSE